MRSKFLRPVLWCCALIGLLSTFTVRPSLADTTVSGTISTDTTWTLSGSPYLVTSTVTVQGTDGADGITTLTIEPGVQVRVGRLCRISIGGGTGAPGALVAQGTAAAPILFTSSQSSPAPGDWYYLEFMDTSDDASSILDHCIVEYAGYTQGGLYIYKSSPTVRNSVFRHNANAGICAGYSSSTFSGNTVSDNSKYGILFNVGSPTIGTSTFSGNSNYDVYFSSTGDGTLSDCTINNGLYVANGTLDAITGNTFNYDNSHPIRLGADGIGQLMTANTFANTDSLSAVEVTADTIEHDAVWPATTSYRMLGTIIVQGTDGADNLTTWTISAGAHLLNRYNKITIGGGSGAPGALVAQGTAAAPILFTSSQSSPAAGDWSSIEFLDTSDDAASIMDHCVVEYAGSVYGTLYLNHASPTVKNTIIRNNNNFGVYSYYSSPNLAGNTISDNASYGLYCAYGTPQIAGSTFLNNGNYDLYFIGQTDAAVTGCTINKGLYVPNGALAVVTGNTFNYDNSYPIRLGAAGVGELMTANTIAGTDEQSYMDVTAGTIERDSTWTATLKYNVLGSITVKGTNGDDGITTWNIAPGVQVRMNGAYQINIGASYGDPGALSAQGTAEAPILFTSNKVSPAPGDWQYIKFDKTCHGATTILDHCIVEYSGSQNTYGTLYFYSDTLKSPDNSPTIQNSTIRYSKYAGLYIYRVSPRISASTISQNNGYGISCNTGAPVIESSAFSGNGNYDIYFSGIGDGTLSDCTINNGLYVPNGTLDAIAGNTFNYNNSYPIRLGVAGIGQLMTANTFANTDSLSAVDVTNGTIVKDSLWTAALKYNVLSYFSVQGTDGDDGITTLTIEPGVQVRVGRLCRISIGGGTGAPGALVAQGTAAAPILFTSSQSSPAPGDWYYLEFMDTSDDASSILDHCIVEYAGYTQGGLYIYKSSPAVRNSVFRHNANAGICAGYSSSTFSGNTVSDNSKYGILFNLGSPTIGTSTFSGNSNYDIYFSSTGDGTLSDCTINNGLYVGSGVLDAITGNTFNYDNSHPVRLGADGIGQLMTANTFANTDSLSTVEVTADTIEHDAVWPATTSYRMLGTITVQGTDGADNLTTWTISAGAHLLNRYNKITIGGGSGAPGALVAQGTAAAPILFTSSQSSPAAGDWSSIEFLDTSDDAATILNHCVVEYAGSSYGALYLYNASPTIQNSTVRYSKYDGIYSAGSGCQSTQLACNTFSGNNRGIFWSVVPPPEMHGNNFTGNTSYGLYYTGSTPLNAEENWWADVQGPGTGGDTFFGNVDADPWSTQLNECIGPVENQPPNTPLDPTPADASVRVAVDNGVSLGWVGGDPNPLDEVTYDLYWGTSPDSLQLEAAALEQPAFTKTPVDPGLTSYWQVIAKDDKGAETPGAVWHFTADGDPPDLIIGQLDIDPPGHLQAGQSVTLTAHIQNSGTGPVVDPFAIDFKADGVSFGSVAVDQILLAGQTQITTMTWTYAGGDPTIDITADSQTQVSETSEDNNHYIALLSEVADNTAPVLMASAPSDGDYLQQIEHITATLIDSQGSIDDAAVIAGFSVTDGDQQSVSGTVTESNDTFTFTPAGLPLPDSAYQVSLTAADTYGNAHVYSFTFNIDTQPPEKPVITGATVASGTIQVRPAQNIADQFMAELTGSREAGTSVWVNGVQQVATGDEAWSVNLLLQPDDNAFEIWLKDRAGNQGESEWVDIRTQFGNAATYDYNAAGRVKRISGQQ